MLLFPESCKRAARQLRPRLSSRDQRILLEHFILTAPYQLLASYMLKFRRHTFTGKNVVLRRRFLSLPACVIISMT
jgi:hypothetical protein